LGEPHQHDLSDPAFAVGLASIFALGCGARFYGLSELPLWMDEASSYFVSTRPLPDILFNKVDIHPPLFYVVQHFWTLIDSNITTFRVPVAAIGSVTVLIVALATSDLVNRWAGLAAGALLALSTGHIYFSQEARVYPLLAFGLALATWGLIGFVDRNRPHFYFALYLIGGVIAIYSHIIAMIYLAILNAIAFTASHMKGHILAINIALLIICLPWLLSIPEAMKGYEGLPPQSITQTHWFFRNLVGFPGIPLPFKIAADAFMLLVYSVGAALAFRGGRQIFAVVTAGVLVIYPLALGTLNLVTPIFKNQIFVPCVIPAAMLFGAAVASLRQRVAQILVLVGALSLALWSEIDAYRLRVKQEDIPQALALADAHGFTGAPVLSCPFTAGTAYLYARNRPVFYLGAQDDQLIRFNDRMLEAYSLPKIDRQQTNGEVMQAFLRKNDLVVDPKTAWASIERVILISTSCGDRARSLEYLLSCLGFHEIEAPRLTRPRRVVIESLWTKLSLWVRGPEKIQEAGCKQP
jgi:uncharacterized membrane protein